MTLKYCKRCEIKDKSSIEVGRDRGEQRKEDGIGSDVHWQRETSV